MKAKHVILYFLVSIIISSCIRDEALNAEADILSCTLPKAVMTTSPIINNNSVTLFVGPETDVSALAPEFTLTPGATISPLSGTVHDFNLPQKYTVTAADGVWKKTYTVSVIDTELATNYNFEDTLGGKKYYIFVERQEDKVIMEWASGNAGYAMTGVPKTADDYPTFQIADGKEGKPVDGKRDICDIYAIMYETSESVPTLDGSNAFTSPNLVSIARIDNAKETDEWTYFKLPFITRPGKFIDKEKLRDGKYNVAIVFTSSLEGAYFNGAIGSTLLIDEVELVYHTEN